MTILYNKHQPYRRQLIDRRGDVCDYVYVKPGLVTSVLRSLGRPEPEDPLKPFAQDSTYCDSVTYSTERCLSKVAERTKVDPLFVEETFLLLLRNLFGHMRRPSTVTRHRQSTIRRHQETIETAKEYLAENLNRPISIGDLALACDTSEFHLCRIFKGLTGITPFKYLMKMRLLEAFDRVLETSVDLMQIAHETGFCSHSHLTEQFRLEIGVPPSELRRTLPTTIRCLREKLIG